MFWKSITRRPNASRFWTRSSVLAHEQGWQDVDVYRYADLRAGQVFTGPAVVEADTTTLAVPEGTDAAVDHLGNIVLTNRKA